MGRYVRIERTDLKSNPAVYKVKQAHLGFAALEALEKLRRDDLHATAYDATIEGGRIRALPADYLVRWATIEEWQEGGER